jgi:hypothetical protein
MDVHNSSFSCSYVMNLFIVYADVFILWYNGPASLESTGSVTELAARLLS